VSDQDDTKRLHTEAKEATLRARQTREEAQAASRVACERLIEQLQEVLGGEPLRGLPNIGASSTPFYGLRVRAEGCGESLPRTAVLCLDAHGTLIMGAFNVKLGLYIRQATPADLRTADAALLAAVILKALCRHVDATGATADRYTKHAALARKIREALR